VTKWLGTAVVALAVGALLVANPSPIAAIVLLFVVVVPFERLFPRHRQPFRRPGLMTDVLYGLTQRALAVSGLVVGAVIGIVSLAWLPGLLLRPLVSALPRPLTVVVGFVVFDLLAYWGHRWSHELPLLWRFHAVHHSSRQMDWVSGLRVHPLDGLVVAPVVVFLLASGFNPRLAGALVVIQIVTGLFLHANVRWRWRPLHRVVITPELHHWHHSNEPDARNHNYTVFLPVWDLVFGTYFMPADRRPQVYGIDQDMPGTIGAQLLQPLRGLPTPWWVVRHPAVAAGRLRRNLQQGRHQIVASALGVRASSPSGA
jgi:sterol desaturase/sphingolipid hydroxylase (fatty acid hydroxylase superfamily)